MNNNNNLNHKNMNKFLAMLAIATSTMFISACSSDDTDDIVNNESKKMSFLVGSPSSESRAVVSDLGNPKVNWETTDQIIVWGETQKTNHVFSFSDYGKNHNYAAFTGDAFKAEKYYIMYPNQSGASFDGSGSITATIPTIQKATANSFDPNAALCAGATEGQYDRSVSILHACAFLKIKTVKECKSITITATGSGDAGSEWKVAGEVTIVASSSGAKITGYNNAVGTVKMTANGVDDTSTFSAGTYLLAVISSTKFPGIRAVVDYADGTKADKSASPTGGFQFNAAYIYNLGTATPNS